MNSSAPSAFHCLRCGACCRWPGTVTLAPGEPDAIAAHLRLPLPDFLDRYTTLAPNRTALVLLDAPSSTRCIFLSGNNACAIYPVRPNQCRTFPFSWRQPGCPALDSSSSPTASPPAKQAGTSPPARPFRAPGNPAPPSMQGGPEHRAAVLRRE